MVWLVAWAFAEGPGLLGDGQRVVYTGVGLSTFQWGSGGDLRDRPLQGRVDLYGAVGLADRWQLSVYAAPAHSRVRPLGRPPCGFEPNYCEAHTTLAKPWVEARVGLAHWAHVGLGVGWDPWNRDRRGQFNTLSQGTLVVTPQVVVGRPGIQGAVRWHAVVWPAIDGHGSPPDTLQVDLELPRTVGAWTLQPGAHLYWRVDGDPHGSDWAQAWYPTADRWAMLRTRQLFVEAKVSYAIGHDGVHVAARRAVWTDSGPKDLTDISVGWHRWFP